VHPSGSDERSRAAHRNLIGFDLLSTERIPGARASYGGGELLSATPHEFPFMQTVLRDHSRPDGERLIARAREFFDGAGFTVWARSSGEDADLERAARGAGLSLALDRFPEMVCDRPVAEPQLPSRTELREVADDEQGAAYWDICGASYPSLGFPPDLFRIYPPRWLYEPPFRACLAYLDGEPAGAAAVAPAEGVGLVVWVATAPEARGRGLAEACTAWVTNRALEDGARFVCLQASPMGEAIYRRMGYEEIYSYRLWAAPPG
jgi:GNAT superfamily N-acetyltransferase